MEEDDLFDTIGGDEEFDVLSELPPRNFAVRADFESDESFLGGIARAGLDNGRGRIGLVLGMAGLPTQTRRFSKVPFVKFDPAPLATLLGVTTTDIEHRLHLPVSRKGDKVNWVKFFHDCVPRRFVSAGRARRFAPAAWNIKPYHRAIWDIQAIPCCLETGELYVDYCPCGRPLKWDVTSLTRCGNPSCCFDMRDAASTHVDAEDVCKLQFFAEIYSPSESTWAAAKARLPSELANLSGAELLDLSVFFGLISSDPHSDQIRKRYTSIVLGNFDSWTARELASGLDVLLGWPRSFYDLADHCGSFASMRPGEHGFKKHLGPLLRHRPGKGFTKRVRKIFHCELRHYFDLRPDLPLSRNNKRQIRVSAPGTITCRTASMRYNVSKPALNRLREYPDLIAREGRPGLPVLYNERPLEEIIKQQYDMISIEDARTTYGITAQCLKQLVGAGFLSYVEGPRSVFHACPYLSKSSIDEFLARIEACQSQSTGNTGVCLAYATRGCRVDNRLFIILTAMAEGKISVLGVDRSRNSIHRRFRIDMAEARNFLLKAHATNEAHILVRYAATCMRMKDSALRELLTKLNVEIVLPRTYAEIRLEDFEYISKKYITAAEIRARFGLGARDVWKYIRLVGLSAAVTLPRHRTYLMCRSEFEAKYSEMRDLVCRLRIIKRSQKGQ
ncbi:hypothetical protein [Microvirga ossetica]|uniref:hypothetical protein n=1 Tax=Microvirga ossetica TaxID=1882682 RepID=UPI0012FFEF9B|nr:hypothetical protein [Microvirga ossetica]